ncbi:DNase I-like protein [Russula earlei]|uniref:DNase I-like protein n=1 Tax=Russula earlei TaxID=71964 RepID=A0ACC0U729_9AGAM|nr:DNase I-like protein [Russula earlei]
MRILSWNLNGVRTIPQYHPWNTFKNWDAVLKELKAHIICFQEMKSSRATIGRDIAMPDSFSSFFSFPAVKGGYSGVAVYTDTDTATPLKAEEGLSGGLQPKPPLSPEERVSTSYPLARDLDLIPDADDRTPNDLLSLDLEGRALVLDFGLFVLVNLYCPNEGSDARFPYKMNYHLMLQERVRVLTAAGREVVVVGDLNVCAAPIDHCDGHLPSNASTFWEHAARAWIRDWLAPRGPLIDVLRKFWPERKGMYTCWNTKISARETNYGTRIDYVLVTPGLLRWIKAGDILPSIKGSDHCPIFVDFHDEITTDRGEKLVLRDQMQMGVMDAAKREPPRLAAKYWPEFQGKQTLMSSFFTKRAAETSPAPTAPTPTSGLSTLATAFDVLEAQPPPPSFEESPASKQPETEPSSPPPTMSPASSQASFTLPHGSQESRKRPPTANSAAAGTSKPKRLKAGQSKLSSFFTKPTTATTAPPGAPSARASSWTSEIIDLCEDSEEIPPPPSLPTLTSEIRLPAEDGFPSAGQSKENGIGGKAGGAASWSMLFAPIQPPLCTVHREPTKEFRVNKPGPNRGKTFFLCARPVGPGYDKGRSERLREEVNHEYKCNFFMWSSDARREVTRAGATGDGVPRS